MTLRSVLTWLALASALAAAPVGHAREDPGEGGGLADRGLQDLLCGATCGPGQPPPLPSLLYDVVYVEFHDYGITSPKIWVAPGWSCQPVFLNGTSAKLDCYPDPLGVLAPPVPANGPGCMNAYAMAGGTFLTDGEATAYVGCRNVGAGPCYAIWTGQGGCDVRLGGRYNFPLRCEVSAWGRALSPGAEFYGVCGIET